MDTKAKFFGAATISEVSMINGDGTTAIIASDVDASFSGQCNAFNVNAAAAVREIGLWALLNNTKVSLGVNASNEIITFGTFKG